MKTQVYQSFTKLWHFKIESEQFNFTSRGFHVKHDAMRALMDMLDLVDRLNPNY